MRGVRGPRGGDGRFRLTPSLGHRVALGAPNAGNRGSSGAAGAPSAEAPMSSVAPPRLVEGALQESRDLAREGQVGVRGTPEARSSA